MTTPPIRGVREMLFNVTVVECAAPEDREAFYVALNTLTAPIGYVRSSENTFSKHVPWVQPIVGTTLTYEFYAAIEQCYIAGMRLATNINYHSVDWPVSAS